MKCEPFEHNHLLIGIENNIFLFPCFITRYLVALTCSKQEKETMGGTAASLRMQFISFQRAQYDNVRDCKRDYR